MDKCNDLRLFLFPYKIWHDSFAEQGKTPEISLKENIYRCICVLFNERFEPLRMQNSLCRNPRGMARNGVRDIL
jgi:hypothetical protein